MTPTPVKPEVNSDQKRPSSVGNTPNKDVPRKKRIPLFIKKKLKDNIKGGSVLRKYSLDKFKVDSGRDTSNSVERLKKNLAKFRNNTIFKKGSESERSVRSRDSKLSS